MVLLVFLRHYWPMSQEHDDPVCREDLTSAVKMALHKAEYLWPGRRRPGDHHRLELVAEAVVEHLALCGKCCFQRRLLRELGAPGFHGTLRRKGGRDGPERAD